MTQPGEQNTVLRLDHITKTFGSLIANNDISLHLRRGEILGLLGENGAGKTTLMNILFGHYVADGGSIFVEGKPLTPGEPKAALAAGVGMVHQHFTLAENLTVLDNIVLGTQSLWAFRSATDKVRDRLKKLATDYGLKIDLDATVASLSVGEKQRVEIIKALYRNATILILDEPTAVLTPNESTALFDTLKLFVAKGLSIIFISHKLGEIMATCNRVAILRSGSLVATRDITLVSRGELAELMVGRQVTQPKASSQAAGRQVLSLSKVSASRNQNRIEKIDLEVRQGEIVGIAGVSGNGQSLLADIVSGVLTPKSGTITLNEKILASNSPRQMVAKGVARIPEDRQAEGLIGDMSVAENVISETYRSAKFMRKGFINWKAARHFAEKIIADYGVKCSSTEAQVRLLSGGNMQKLILGRVMEGQPSLILANQPTRGLDVGAVAHVHEQLLMARKRGAGIILISEDLDELLALSDRVAVMYQGRLSALFKQGEFTIRKLGLMMAGQDVTEGQVDAA